MSSMSLEVNPNVDPRELTKLLRDLRTNGTAGVSEVYAVLAVLKAGGLTAEQLQPAFARAVQHFERRIAEGDTTAYGFDSFARLAHEGCNPVTFRQIAHDYIP